MRSLISIHLLAGFLICISCYTKKEAITGLENIPIEQAIKSVYPGAVPFNDYTDSLLFFLYAVHNIGQDKILLGQSSCTDDVINAKDFFANHAVKGPFNLGGLAGLVSSYFRKGQFPRAWVKLVRCSSVMNRNFSAIDKPVCPTWTCIFVSLVLQSYGSKSVFAVHQVCWNL